MPGLALGHLLGAAVVVADVGHRVDDLLAVELQHHAQHAVGARVLRPDVQEHEVGVLVRRGQPPVLGPEAQGLLLLARPASVGEDEAAHLGGAGRVVLAQRVALPGGRHQDAAQVRVAVEADAEHVPDLALVPVGGRPDAGDAWAATRFVVEAGTLSRRSALRSKREQVVDDGEVARPAARRGARVALVDRR